MKTKIISLEIGSEAHYHHSIALNSKAIEHEKAGNLNQAEKFYRLAVEAYLHNFPDARDPEYYFNIEDSLNAFLHHMISSNSFFDSFVNKARNDHLAGFIMRQTSIFLRVNQDNENELAFPNT